ncbi:MAG: cytochrome c peroxidase [Minicystis sp.]
MKRALLFMAMFAAAGAGCAQTETQTDAQSDEPRVDEPIGEVASADGTAPSPSNMARVGRQIFFDTNLSSPAGQSCASCHSISRMFSDPDTGVPTSEGVVSGRFGVRNAQSLAYAAFSGPLSYIAAEGGYAGGMFWDGRVNTLAEQAKQPFLNPLEMNNPDKATVVAKVQASVYAPMFIATFGANAFADVDTAYDNIGKALQQFQQLRLFFPFTAKWDAYQAGKATLTAAEARGLAIFSDTERAACITCHPSGPDADGSVAGLFTDFGYDNLGLPKNPSNPFYSEPAFNPDGSAYNDRGLGATLDDTDFDGAFKAPSLRNLGRTGPYFHNGIFSTLKDVVHFYNTRDVPGAGWAAPEFPASMNTADLGNLGLTNAEEDDLVTFLGTLNDAAPVINGSCSITKGATIYNKEYPAHEPGLCGAQEFLLEEATIFCGGNALKYFGYSCNNTGDGMHTWLAYVACC